MMAAGLMIVLLGLGGLGGLGLTAAFSVRRFSAMDKAVLAVLWAPLFLSVLALALAQAGCFRLPALLLGAALWGAAGLAGLFRQARARRESPPEQNAGGNALFLTGLAVLLAAAGWLAIPAHRYLLGGWDPGEYVCTAAQMARTGELAIHDPVLPTLSAAERTALMHEPAPPRRTLQAGYLVVDEAKGLLLPDYYHLHPAWLAVWVRLFGLAGAWAGHSFMALAALAMVVLAAARLVGRRAALLTGLMLMLCPAQAYLMRFTTAEMMTQFCLFAGFWALASALRQPGGAGLALTAAAAFGAAILAHGTSVLPVAGVVAALGFRALLRREGAAWRPALAVGAGAGLALLWNAWRADIMTRFLWNLVSANPRVWTAAGVIILGTGAAAALLARSRAGREPGPARAFLLRWGPFAAAALLAVYGYWIRPANATDADAKNLLYFAALAGKPALILAVLYFALPRDGRERGALAAFLLAGALAAVVLLGHKMVQPVYLWAARRWVPMVVPFVLLLASAAAVSLVRGRGVGRSAGLAAAALAVGFWLAGLLPGARLVYGVREYENLPGLLRDLAGRVKDADAVICSHWEPATPLRYAYGIPAWQLSRLPNPEGLRDARAAGGLIARWVAEGKRVYWIGERFYHPGFDLQEAGVEAGAFSVLERRRDRLPGRVAAESFRFPVYRAVPPAPRAENGPVALDVGHSAMGLAAGFSELERERDPVKKEYFGYRRTRGRGRLYLPSGGGAWRVRLNGFLRPGVPCPVELRAGGQTIARFAAEPRWAEYAFTLPAGPGTNSVTELEIRSPHVTRGGGRRGVAVDWLRRGE
jgi:hypothetical protein